MIALLAVSTSVLAQGKQLHDSSCLQCHASLTGGQPDLIYSRAGRTVNSLDALSKRVAACVIVADVNWTAEQQQQVVDYLNSQFYKF